MPGARRRMSVSVDVKTHEREAEVGVPEIATKARLARLNALRAHAGRSLIGLAGVDVLHPAGLTAVASNLPGTDRRTARSGGQETNHRK
jgi:hypothetical protein